MSNFGISQNFRSASINRKLSRTNTQTQDENVFEKDSTFVLNLSKDGVVSKLGNASSATTTSVSKPVANKLHLNSTKTNRLVVKSVDHF